MHLFGRPAPLEELPDELLVLEDAAGALGARYRGRACGGLGLLGCLSFHPRKIVTTGEGGAVTTNDARDRRRGRGAAQPRLALARAARHAGARVSTTASRTSSAPSASRRCAASTSCSPSATRDRRRATRERLRDLPVLLPRADEGDVHGWQAYVIQVDDRDRVLAALRAQGIEAQIGTYALHLLGAYRDQGAFPGAARVFERALALPFHTRLTEGELDRVAEALDKLVSHH